ncbi:hypothetical protein YC2023_108021 [Brassica napus]
MMGSHPGGRVTACSVGCSILEYLMEMMAVGLRDLDLFRELRIGGVTASVQMMRIRGQELFEAVNGCIVLERDSGG